MGRYETIHVTPDVATQLLQHNEHNRTIRPLWVKKYAREMTEGRWARNGETIGLFERADGTTRLVNGQHRLLAITQSGVSLDLDFFIASEADGDDEDIVFGSVDGGAKRSFQDVVRGRLSDLGDLMEIPPKMVSEAVNSIIVSDIMIPSGKTEAMLVSSERKMQIAREHLDEIEWIADVMKGYKKAIGRNIPIGCRAALLRCYRFAPEQAMTFAQRLIDGAMLIPGNAIYALRNELIRGMVPGVKTTEILYWYQLTARAWNHHVNGRVVHWLKVGKIHIDPIAPPVAGVTTNGEIDPYLAEEAEEMRIAARSKR